MNEDVLSLTKSIVVSLNILEIKHFDVGVGHVVLGKVAPVSGQEVDGVQVLPAGPVLGVQLGSEIVDTETRLDAIHESAEQKQK